MTDRADLGAMFARVTRRLFELERPLLEARGLAMWGYVVLARLADGATPTQLALARDIGYDKTRLIGVLDVLERDGLVAREPDPADRRARIVTITASGRRRYTAAHNDIRAMEDDVLAELGPRERVALLNGLAVLDRP